jgi:hypothetical protein
MRLIDTMSSEQIDILKLKGMLPSHLSMSATNMHQPLTLDQTESFSEWLDATNDSIPPPPSFEEWLAQNEDSM